MSSIDIRTMRRAMLSFHFLGSIIMRASFQYLHPPSLGTYRFVQRRNQIEVLSRLDLSYSSIFAGSHLRPQLAELAAGCCSRFLPECCKRFRASPFDAIAICSSSSGANR